MGGLQKRADGRKEVQEYLSEMEEVEAIQTRSEVRGQLLAVVAKDSKEALQMCA